MYCYVDPDHAGQDQEIVALLKGSTLGIINQDSKDKTIAQTSPVEQGTRAVVGDFFALLSGSKQGDIADFFSEEVDFDIPGNATKFIWLRKRKTKQEAVAFFNDMSNHIKQEKFVVDFIAFDGENATAVGALSSLILKYSKVFDSAFVIIFKVVDGKIVKYHFLEDSYKLDSLGAEGGGTSSFPLKL